MLGNVFQRAENTVGKGKPVSIPRCSPRTISFFFSNSEKKKEETYLHIALFIQDNVNKTMKTTQTIPETYR